ncbi:MAG TPA: TrkA family potassium uptake protein [Erysipelothrix sp.]|jgi:trk system potassium uptake protein TrkA|nr:TrkA family potassium uptake protein [Erysipelothrix sp.]
MKPKVIAVLGLGVFGSSICKSLSEFDNEVIAVDIDIENVERIDQYVTSAAVADITNLEALRSLGIENADIGIVATGSNLEATLLACLNLKALGVPKVIAKAKNKTYLTILEKIGVDKVVRPEKEMGEKMARELMRNNIIDTIYLDDHYSVVEFVTPKRWENKTLLELDVRKNFGINIIGVKESIESSMSVQLDGSIILRQNNIIVAIAEREEFENLDFLNKL